jgi:hypothetical protein
MPGTIGEAHYRLKDQRGDWKIGCEAAGLLTSTRIVCRRFNRSGSVSFLELNSRIVNRIASIFKIKNTLVMNIGYV